MTFQQIRDSIVVKWKEREGCRVASATLSISREIHVPKAPRFEPAFSDEFIEEKLKDQFIRELYEDRREEVWKAVEAVQMANPHSGDLRDKLNHLFNLMKHAQPK